MSGTQQLPAGQRRLSGGGERLRDPAAVVGTQALAEGRFQDPAGLARPSVEVHQPGGRRAERGGAQRAPPAPRAAGPRQADRERSLEQPGLERELARDPTGGERADGQPALDDRSSGVGGDAGTRHAREQEPLRRLHGQTLARRHVGGRSTRWTPPIPVASPDQGGHAMRTFAPSSSCLRCVANGGGSSTPGLRSRLCRQRMTRSLGIHGTRCTRCSPTRARTSTPTSSRCSPWPRT